MITRRKLLAIAIALASPYALDERARRVGMAPELGASFIKAGASFIKARDIYKRVAREVMYEESGYVPLSVLREVHKELQKNRVPAQNGVFLIPEPAMSAIGYYAMLRDASWYAYPRGPTRYHIAAGSGVALCNSSLLLNDTTTIRVRGINRHMVCKRCLKRFT